MKIVLSYDEIVAALKKVAEAATAELDTNPQDDSFYFVVVGPDGEELEEVNAIEFVFETVEDYVK